MTGEIRSIAKVVLMVIIAVITTVSTSTLAGCGSAISVPPKGHPGKSNQSAKEVKPKEDREKTATETLNSTETLSPPIETQITTDTVINQNEPSKEDTKTAASTESTITPQRTLRLGLQGEDVKRLQERLISLGYSPGAADGHYNRHTRHAVIAFQKVNGLSRDGVAGPKTLQALENPKGISAKYGGSHIEVSKAYQILLVVKDGKVVRIISTSTGRRGHSTPTITSAVDWKAGYLYESKKYGGTMVWSSFFYGGIAVHGFSSAPPFPASHGCVRVPIPDSKYVYDNMPIGSMVYVY